jgi:hypothetical protein
LKIAWPIRVAAGAAFINDQACFANEAGSPLTGKKPFATKPSSFLCGAKLDRFADAREDMSKFMHQGMRKRRRTFPRVKRAKNIFLWARHLPLPKNPRISRGFFPEFT